MFDSITFLDVETPNRHNDSICSIGLVTTDLSGRELDRAYTLVNPQTRFDDVNMRIHGISPVDVSDAPTFAEAWSDVIWPRFDGSLLVAHNAAFDLCVIWKAAATLGIGVDHFDYACTQRMARSILPPQGDYKLDHLCDTLGVRMGRHHDAAADADGCMGLFWSLREMAQGDVSPYVDTYRGPGASSRVPRPRGSAGTDSRPGRTYSQSTNDMRDLIKIVGRVTSDGDVSVDEAAALLSWMLSRDSLAGDPVVARLMDELQEALEDGDISLLESDELVGELDRLANPLDGHAEAVEFDGRLFCLTGDFEHGSKSAVTEYIESRGGTVKTGVTKKCSYVVMGGCGSEAYSLGSYGTKVKKAMELQEKGVPVKVINECDLYRD
ncbi:exonuclease domain-containing protein [Olsenella phocaeensis]|uniref:exonuclease domain-containing protein n=1 Tax=Olsenella phocaeensis TaxID=1852385 RepID=UPI003A8FE4D9